MKLVLVLAALVAVALADKARYDFYRVYSVQVKDIQQFKLLTLLQEQDMNYDFWTDVEAVGRKVDIMVPPHKRGEFSDLMDKNAFEYSIKVQNVQEKIDQERPAVASNVLDWTDYYGVDDINTFLDRIIQENAGVTGFTVGRSVEDRPIRGVRISRGTGNMAIFVEANMHAREWISSATATYLINQLATSTNANIRSLTERYDWYIIPVANPDGLEFSRSNTRMWRKTRNQNAGSICTGTDGNRNFDFQWMANGGASSNACSATFAGPSPFSTPEASSMASFYRNIASNVGVFVSIHAFGQFVLYPYGHTDQPSAIDLDLHAMAGAYVNATRTRFGTEYTFGPVATLLYVASGASPDYAYSLNPRTAAFTLELRDTGDHGFQLPASQIIPNGEETIDGLIAMIATAEARGFLN